MKTYFIYNENNPHSRELYEKAEEIVSKSGFACLSGSNFKEMIADSRFLVVVFSDEADATNSNLTEKWRYFHNEMRWKRKAEGDIVVLTPQGFNTAKIPFALKDSFFLHSDDFAPLPALLKKIASKTVIAEQTGSIERVQSVERSKSVTERVVMNSPKVEFSQKPDNGCKEDHIFSKNSDKTSRHNTTEDKPIKKTFPVTEQKTEKAAEKKIEKIHTSQDPFKQETENPFELFLNKKYYTSPPKNEMLEDTSENENHEIRHIFNEELDRRAAKKTSEKNNKIGAVMFIIFIAIFITIIVTNFL